MLSRIAAPNHLLVACAVSLLTLAACQPAGGPIARRSAPIFGGTAHTGHTAVGILNIGGLYSLDQTAAGSFGHYIARFPGGSMCTATLVGTKTVLTAAHCVIDGRSFSFELDTGELVEAASATPHPEYRGMDHDIAVVRLAREVKTVKPQPIATDPPKEGTTITLVGYGATNCYSEVSCEDDAGIKRIADNTIAQVRTGEFTFVGGGSTCKGDSGGPAFAKVAGGQEVQVGVTSRGDLPCGKEAIDTRVDVFVEWIKQEADGDVMLGDTVAPTVAIVEPPAGAVLEPSTVEVRAEVEDDRALATVSMQVDGQPAGQLAGDAEPVFHVELGAGEHDLTVIAEDEAGNEGQATVAVTVRQEQQYPEPPPVSEPAGALLGAQCEGHDECQSGLCADDRAAGRRYCSQACSPGETSTCPNGGSCVQTDGAIEHVCLFAEPGAHALASALYGGCSLPGPDRGPGGGWLIVWAIGVMALARRRRQ